MIYYGSTMTLSERTNMPYGVCDELRTRWLTQYNVAADWMDTQYNSHHDYVEDVFGRRMRIPWDKIGQGGR